MLLYHTPNWLNTPPKGTMHALGFKAVQESGDLQAKIVHISHHIKSPYWENQSQIKDSEINQRTTLGISKITISMVFILR